MRKVFVLAALCGIIQSAAGETFETVGDGTVYTLDMLSAISGSGVTASGSVYTIVNDVTIAEGDSFVVSDKAQVMIGNDVRITIKGGASFDADEVTVGPIENDDTSIKTPYGLVFDNAASTYQLKGINFVGCGIRCLNVGGMNLSHCSFIDHNGVSGSAALQMGANGAAFTITDCSFAGGQRSAIGGAANYSNPVVIDHCTFTRNGQANRNAPQLNLTVADSVIIRGCVLEGDSTKNMVGGIVVANMLGLVGDFHTLIEGCEIRDHRFGLATYLKQKAVIRNNQIVNNHHETNPMNGGSGINIYDPYRQQDAYVEGNRIEGNLWGITVIGGQDVNLGKTEVGIGAPDYNPGRNQFLNNGCFGEKYDVYNNSTITVYAQGNEWLTAEAQTAEAIEACIYHGYDDTTLGQVIYTPWYTAPTSVSSIAANVGDEAIYTLDGRRTDSSHRGMVILKNGGRVKKLIMR